MPTMSSTRPRIRRESQPPHAVDGSMATLFRAVGLVERAEQVEAIYTVAAAVDANTDASALAADLHDELTRAVYKTMADPMTLVDNAVALHTARQRAAAIPVVNELSDLVRNELHVQTARALWRAGDTLVHELDAVVKSSVAAIVAAAPAAEEINNDSDAIAAGGAASKAWVVLCDQTRTIETAWSIASMLRTNGFLSDINEAGPRNWQQADPDVVVPYVAERHPARTMVAVIEAGAGPGSFTADEVIAEVYGSTST